jgi:hypothetical protein
MQIEFSLLNHHVKKLICLAALLFLVAVDRKTTAQTSEPSREPILRIEILNPGSSDPI